MPLRRWSSALISVIQTIDIHILMKLNLKAIMQLHSIGIIHRDVKGSNFAIGLGDQSKTVRMIDFGFARLYVSILITKNHVHFEKVVINRVRL